MQKLRVETCEVLHGMDGNATPHVVKQTANTAIALYIVPFSTDHQKSEAQLWNFATQTCTHGHTYTATPSQTNMNAANTREQINLVNLTQ